MGAIGVVLLVAFVIVCILLVLLVIVQDDGENGMGGLLGGRSTAAFGSHSGSVLTKTTFVLVVLFFALTVALAFINKKPKIAKDLVEPVAVTETQSEETEAAEKSEWWEESDMHRKCRKFSGVKTV